MCAEEVPFLLLSGPPGVGKTTVAWAIFDQLIARGDRPGFADLDLLGACWPTPEDDPHNERLKARNLREVWRNYAANGATCLVAAGVIENETLLDLYRGAVDHSAVVLCRLRAGDSELHARIRARGRERGADVNKLARRAVQLATDLERNDVADVVIDTEGRDAGEVARLILAQAWPG